MEELKKMARILGLLDVLEPEVNGLYVDVNRVIQGDFRTIDVFEESADDSFIKEIIFMDKELKRNKDSGIRTSNVDVLKSYRPLLRRLYNDISKRGERLVRGNGIFYFDCEYKRSYVPHLLVAYEQSTLRALNWYDEKLKVGGTIPLSGRPRLPRMGVDDWKSALKITE